MKLILSDKYYKGTSINTQNELLSRAEIEAMIAAQGVEEITEANFITKQNAGQLTPLKWYKVTNGRYDKYLYIQAVTNSTIARFGYRVMLVPDYLSISGYNDDKVLSNLENRTFTTGEKYIYKNHVYQVIQNYTGLIPLEQVGQISDELSYWIPNSTYFQLIDKQTYSNNEYIEQIFTIELPPKIESTSYIISQTDSHGNTVINIPIFDELFDSIEYFNSLMITYVLDAVPHPQMDGDIVDYMAESVNISSYYRNNGQTSLKSNICFGLINLKNCQKVHCNENVLIIDNVNTEIHRNIMQDFGFIGYNKDCTIISNSINEIKSNTNCKINYNFGKKRIKDKANDTTNYNLFITDV